MISVVTRYEFPKLEYHLGRSFISAYSVQYWHTAGSFPINEKKIRPAGVTENGLSLSPSLVILAIWQKLSGVGLGFQWFSKSALAFLIRINPKRLLYAGGESLPGWLMWTLCGRGLQIPNGEKSRGRCWEDNVRMLSRRRRMDGWLVRGLMARRLQRTRNRVSLLS